MSAAMQEVWAEVAENWPAFTYILMTLGFSVCYFRSRRAELRLLQEIADALQRDIRAGFDRLEYLAVEQQSSRKAHSARAANS